MTRKELVKFKQMIEENEDILKKKFSYTQLVLNTIENVLELNPLNDNENLSLYAVEDFAKEIQQELEIHFSKAALQTHKKDCKKS